MPWPLVALAWVVWLQTSTSPCDTGRPAVARQALTGSVPGTASVDLSADGRYAAFISLARLDPADENAVDDVYVLDRVSGRVGLESLAAEGRASNGSSEHPRLSGDGRFVVFATIASNLLPGSGDPRWPQVVRRDRVTGTLVLVSHGPGQQLADGWSGDPEISEDGRYVAFDSRATNLAAPDGNGSASDVYLFDAMDGSVRRVSVASGGVQPASGDSTAPAISGDGRRVVFTSTAPLDTVSVNLARGAAPVRLVFLHDAVTGTTRRISTAKDGRAPNGPSYFPTISADGRRVAFVSTATNLAIDGRSPRQESLYLFDVEGGRLRLASRSATGGAPDGYSRHPALSRDGRYLAFSSNASNLECADGCAGTDRADLNLVSDVYRVDTATGAAARVSGASAREPWWNASAGASIDDSGRVVAFSSRQPIDEDDLDHDDDLYVEVLPAAAGDMAAAPCGPDSRANPPR